MAFGGLRVHRVGDGVAAQADLLSRLDGDGALLGDPRAHHGLDAFHRPHEAGLGPGVADAQERFDAGVVNVVVGQEDPVRLHVRLIHGRFGMDELLRRPHPGKVRVHQDDGARRAFQRKRALPEPVNADGALLHLEVVEGVHCHLLLHSKSGPAAAEWGSTRYRPGARGSVISSMASSSSRVKPRFSRALTFSSICSTRDAPTRTLVTCGSLRIQAMAIWAKVWPRALAISFSLRTFSRVSAESLLLASSSPQRRAARDSPGMPPRYLSVRIPWARGE